MSELNLKSTTIEKGLDLAKDFLQSLVKPSIDEMGLMLSDNVKMWRLRNQIRNLNKVKELVDKAGFSPKQVDMKVMFPYLEGVAVEEDEDLQTMWANLLTNYIDPAKHMRVTVFPQILAQLSSEEVAVLKYLPKSNGDLQNWDSENYFLAVDPKAFANLERLGLVESSLKATPNDSPGERKPWGPFVLTVTKEEYQLTTFGLYLMQACSRD